MKACLPSKPMYCSREYQASTRLIQQYEKSTSKYVLCLNSLQRKWITFTKSYKTTTTQHSSFNKAKPQQKTNKKPNPSTGKSIEGARVVIPYIKGFSEQYRHILVKYRIKELSLKVPVPSNLYSCIQKIQFQMLRKLIYSTTRNAQPTTAQLNT